ncbi:MAG: response regulator, partial [Pirellulales bacterium]|nr:response regulator [Pirellulales bacterium]
AEDGQAAWDIMLAGEYVFDLLVTDIEMPNLNGLDLCRRVKDHPAFSDMPVIALTSLAGEEDFRRGEESGIDDYQVKFDRERTLASVAKFMKNRRESQMSGQPMNNVRS